MRLISPELDSDHSIISLKVWSAHCRAKADSTILTANRPRRPPQFHYPPDSMPLHPTPPTLPAIQILSSTFFLGHSLYQVVRESMRGILNCLNIGNYQNVRKALKRYWATTVMTQIYSVGWVWQTQLSDLQTMRFLGSKQ